MLNIFQINAVESDSDLCSDSLAFYNISENATIPFFTARNKEFPLVMTSVYEMAVKFESCLRERPQKPLGFIGKVSLTGEAS